MSDNVDYTWEAAALQRMPNQDCYSYNSANLCMHGDVVVLDFSSLKLIDGEKITITGDYDLVNTIKDYILNTRNVVDGYIVHVIEDQVYLTYELDDNDNLTAVLHLSFQYQEEEWAKFLRDEMHKINAPGNFYWVGSSLYQEL